MSLLRIDASILGHYSSSRALADVVQREWAEQHPHGTIVTRDLAADPIPSTAWIAGVSAGQTPAENQTEEQKAGLALAHELYQELVSADAVIVATGLYNYGLNQLVKSWIDQVLVVAQGLGEILKGKDVALVVTRGGYYGEDGPKAGWDHGTPWLVRIFSEVWGANVTVVERDFTLVGVNPALDQFKLRAAELQDAATATAEQAGRVLAGASSAAA